MLTLFTVILHASELFLGNLIIFGNFTHTFKYFSSILELGPYYISAYLDILFRCIGMNNNMILCCNMNRKS